MKSVNSLIKWILFVPVCLMSLVITIFNGVDPSAMSSFFGTDQNGLAGIIAFSVLGLFIVCFLISLLDRKISPVHLLKKNYFCGVVAVMSALAMAGNAAYDVTLMVNSGAFDFMSLITVLFTAVGGVTMLYIGLNHFSGVNTPKNISILYLSLPVWCAAHLIDRFLGHTASPVAAADTMDLIMFVAFAMFFSNATMIHALIPGKHAVKSTINFGFPSVIMGIVYGLNLAFNVFSAEKFEFLSLLPSLVYILLALYAMGFTAELSFFSKTVEEQIIIETEDEDSEKYSEEYYSEEDALEQLAVADIDGDQQVSEDAEELEGNAAEVTDETAVTDYEPEKDKTSEATVEPVIPERRGTVVPAVVRIVDDSQDEDESEEVLRPDEDTEDAYDSENSTADELFKVAQQKDAPKTDENKPTGSDSEVIIDGDDNLIIPPLKRTNASGNMPKGPTTREAIAYEDDDFILSIDNTDNHEPIFDEDEDISAFILESHDVEDKKNSSPKTYEERLDEIDRLIISLQGEGASVSTEEE